MNFFVIVFKVYYTAFYKLFISFLWDILEKVIYFRYYVMFVKKMVNQIDALKILNREKNYEDKLFLDLAYYCEACMSDIKDLNSEEKQKVVKILGKIGHESLRHKNLFVELIGMVIENEETEY